MRHWHLPVAVVVLAAVYLNLRGHLPSAHSVGVALASAGVGWIVAAAACQAVSLAMFAYQQRWLLHAVGAHLSVPRAMAVTYARMAIVISMPAGGALSAGYAFQQYRRAGAGNHQAAAVTVLSAIVSVLGLGGLCVAGAAAAVVASPDTALDQQPTLVYVAAGTLVLACGGWWLLGSASGSGARRRLGRAWLGGGRAADATAAAEAEAEGEATRSGRWRDRLRATAREAVDAARSIRPVDLVAGSAFAAGSWLFDAVCLMCSAAAFRLPVSVLTVATLYLAIQVVLQIPTTPGGIGVVEAALLAGLTHAGVAAAPAAAAILTYRVLSCWALIPLGGLAWLGLRRPPRHRT